MDLFLRRQSSVRGIYQWGSVYFMIPWAGSEDLVVICSEDFLVMMVMYSPVPFISEFLSWIYGCSVPQMVVISSEAVTQCSGCSDDLEDGTVHCIHTSTSFSFCIYLHLTHVYPYAGDILDRDPG